jgi:hypothetical protein
MPINRETPEYARGAIERLNARRTGRASCDAWIDYAIRQWKPLVEPDPRHLLDGVEEGGR